MLVDASRHSRSSPLVAQFILHYEFQGGGVMRQGAEMREECENGLKTPSPGLNHGTDPRQVAASRLPNNS